VKGLYVSYLAWAKDNGYMQRTKSEFIAELERHYTAKRGSVGVLVIGLAPYTQNLITY
jgi:hypothetical protein